MPHRQRRKAIPEKQRSLLALGLAVLLGAGALVCSLVPGGVRSLLHSQGRLHPYIHAVLFLLIAELATLSTQRRDQRLERLLGVVALGVAIELAEALRFSNALEIGDILADAAGALLGAAVVLALERLRRRL